MKSKFIVITIAIMLSLTACGTTQQPETEDTTTAPTSVSATEEFTEDPTEELTEELTEEPTEEPTEKPTEAPTEEPTEKETEKITEEENTIKYIDNDTSSGGFWANGSGDYVAENLNVTHYAKLNITHNGSSNFIVQLYEDGKRKDLLVNEIGNYSGTVLVEDTGVYSLEIKADGNWNITSSGLDVTENTSFSGTGDGVTAIQYFQPGNALKVTHSGESNFVIKQYSLGNGYEKLLVNEIGNYSGIVQPELAYESFFAVEADGQWSIAPN